MTGNYNAALNSISHPKSDSNHSIEKWMHGKRPYYRGGGKNLHYETMGSNKQEANKNQLLKMSNP